MNRDVLKRHLISIHVNLNSIRDPLFILLFVDIYSFHFLLVILFTQLFFYLVTSKKGDMRCGKTIFTLRRPKIFDKLNWNIKSTGRFRHILGAFSENMNFTISGSDIERQSSVGKKTRQNEEVIGIKFQRHKTNLSPITMAEITKFYRYMIFKLSLSSKSKQKSNLKT